MISLIIFSCLWSIQAQPVDEKEKVAAFPEPEISFSPKQYVCYRAGEPVIIDGNLNESDWQSASWTDYFVDIEGSLKQAPRYRTQAKMTWDDHYFYFAAELEEPHVWATLTQRDTVIFYDNDFEVFIDPDGDTHHYYELEINAFSTEWDLFLAKPYRDGGPALNAWDIAGLKTAVHINGTINDPGDLDQGWTVEIAIPWHILGEAAHKNVPPKAGDQWRVNFSRVEWQTEVKDGQYEKMINPETGKPFPEANWVWSPQGLINMHYPEMWAFVQFSDKTAGKNADEFRMNPEERIKWVLRQIYYRQKTHFKRYGSYTDQFGELQIADPKLEDIQWPPELHHTPSLFEACVKSVDGYQKWSITQDGRVK